MHVQARLDAVGGSGEQQSKKSEAYERALGGRACGVATWHGIPEGFPGQADGEDTAAALLPFLAARGARGVCLAESLSWVGVVDVVLERLQVDVG